MLISVINLFLYLVCVVTPVRLGRLGGYSLVFSSTKLFVEGAQASSGIPKISDNDSLLSKLKRFVESVKKFGQALSQPKPKSEEPSLKTKKIKVTSPPPSTPSTETSGSKQEKLKKQEQGSSSATTTLKPPPVLPRVPRPSKPSQKGKKSPAATTGSSMPLKPPETPKGEIEKEIREFNTNAAEITEDATKIPEGIEALCKSISSEKCKEFRN